MQKPKTASSSLGARNRCQNFSLCPLCYGCRNYRREVLECDVCFKDNSKFNICDTKKHNSKVISKFIQRNKVVL